MINDVFAIIDRSKQRSLPKLVSTAIEDGVYIDGCSAKIVVDRPEICMGIVAQTDNKDGRCHYESRDLILHGKICQDIKFDSSWEHLEFEQLSDRVYDGVYNLLLWCDRTKSLLVISDYLSTKSLYYWQQDEITVISSTLKAFRLLPFIPQQLNPRVLASTLALSHPLSDDTLIEGVKTPPINCATVFQEQIEFIPRRSTNSGIDSTSSEAELLARLDSLMEQSLQVWLRDRPHSIISLSGGLDSRILLGYLQRSHTDLTAATWGEPGSDDFKLGVELARATNTECLTHTFTGDRAIAESDLKFPGWHTESFSVNNVPFYWKGWIDLLKTQNLPVVHGFLGGPLGGGRLLKWGVSQDYLGREIDDTAIALVNSWGMNAAPQNLLELAQPGFEPYLTQNIAKDLTDAFTQIDRPYVYQRLMCLDFYYRQRRYLGNAISKILGMFLPTILPFYTKDNLDFVLQLPLELILDRAIFRKLLLKQFPELTSFTEADKGKLPIYNNSWKKYRDRLIENRYMWYLFPKFKPRNSALVFSLLLEKHLPIFIETIADSATIVNNYIDIEKLIDKLKSEKVSPSDRAAIVRIFNICTFVNRYFD